MNFLPWLAFLLLVLLPPGSHGHGHPENEDAVTVLHTRIVALDIDEIDSAAQSFVANLFVSVRWLDDRLRHPGPGNRIVALDEVWSPSFQFVNQQKVFRTFPEQLHVAPDGEVTYRQRVWGAFSQKLRLEEFPFDRQRFEAVMVPALADGQDGEIVIVQDQEEPSGLFEGYSLPDWTISHWEAGPAEFSMPMLDASRPAFVFAFETRRHLGYYVLKVLLPLMLIVMMSWIVFWVDPSDMGTQISVAVTSMLTLIAYRFAVGSELPNVAYLTRMDLFILGSTLMVFATLIEAVLSGLLAKQGNLVAARRLDRISRIVYPAATASLAAYTLVL